MGALHFLDELVVPDAYDKSTFHGLELFETEGRLFFRIWVGGIGADKPLVCELTPSQARQLSAGAEDLADRISGS
ncbi:hypothetical protein [Chromobacterium phragmitis]|uniref:hypothetical protein n=1 Tax=Chromobacterium phragmitis TaxID=2202141 RepID=UPI003877E820